jgi:hypothetical protein
MSNFTISWKIMEKLGEAGSWRRAGRGKLGAEPTVASWKSLGELEKFVKFYISWKFIFINKNLFLFILKNKIFDLFSNLCYNKRGNININIYIIIYLISQISWKAGIFDFILKLYYNKKRNININI